MGRGGQVSASRFFFTLILSQALIILIGWASLTYAWGLEIKRWPVALAYLVVQSVTFPILCAIVKKPSK